MKTHRVLTNQKVIDKIVDQLNTKTIHFYNLPFALPTLRKAQHKNIFFSSIICYLEDNHRPTNIKCQQSIIAKAENYLVFNSLLFYFKVKLTKQLNINILSVSYLSWVTVYFNYTTQVVWPYIKVLLEHITRLGSVSSLDIFTNIYIYTLWVVQYFQLEEIFRSIK